MKANLLAAVGLMLMLEGMLPFFGPALWRDTFKKMIDMSDGQLRFIGLGSIIGGLLLLFLAD